MSRPHRRLGRRLLAVVVVVELLAAGGVLFINSRDSTTPVAVDDAVERFQRQQNAASTGSEREPTTRDTSSSTTTTGPESASVTTTEPEVSVSTSSGGGSGGGSGSEPSDEGDAGLALPAPGVYVYDTTGFEEIDAFGGTRHDYPEETAVTVVEASCGVSSRWEPIEERWDEWVTCPGDDGAEWESFATYHEFFDQSEQHTFECGPGATMRPTDTTPGTAWEYRCEDAGSWFENRVEVVGFETLQVGGEPVETLHIHIDSVLGGANRGTATFDYWYDLERSLEVRVVEQLDTESDSPFGVGTIEYHEEFDLRLQSLEPRR